MQCAGANQPYEFLPFSEPLVKPTDYEPNVPVRVIAWCPAPVHFGRRRILLETGGNFPVYERGFRIIQENGFKVTGDELVRFVNMD